MPDCGSAFKVIKRKAYAMAITHTVQLFGQIADILLK